jgi:hypothetical protein
MNTELARSRSDKLHTFTADQEKMTEAFVLRSRIEQSGHQWGGSLEVVNRLGSDPFIKCEDYG